ncbi:MAG: DUF559 domain-containing protein [Sphingomonas fennica]
MIDKGQRPDSPPLQGRGRGWGLSVAELDRRQGFARAMRNDPTEPERRLWKHLRASQIDGFKFRRQSAIGPYIADFYCPTAGLVVEVDGDTHIDAAADVARDEWFADRGLTTLRVSNRDVIENIDGVLARISAILAASTDRTNSPHPNPSPEGEGLSG